MCTLRLCWVGRVHYCMRTLLLARRAAIWLKRAACGFPEGEFVFPTHPTLSLRYRWCRMEGTGGPVAFTVFDSGHDPLGLLRSLSVKLTLSNPLGVGGTPRQRLFMISRRLSLTLLIMSSAVRCATPRRTWFYGGAKLYVIQGECDKLDAHYKDLILLRVLYGCVG